jgi:hypothetical protein
VRLMHPETATLPKRGFRVSAVQANSSNPWRPATTVSMLAALSRERERYVAAAQLLREAMPRPAADELLAAAEEGRPANEALLAKYDV